MQVPSIKLNQEVEVQISTLRMQQERRVDKSYFQDTEQRLPQICDIMEEDREEQEEENTQPRSGFCGWWQLL